MRMVALGRAVRTRDSAGPNACAPGHVHAPQLHAAAPPGPAHLNVQCTTIDRAERTVVWPPDWITARAKYAPLGKRLTPAP
jgi:hypothetical protein